MSIVLSRIDDPRDNLEKTPRDGLIDFARANGIGENEISEQMPAILIRKKLRERGLVNIKPPPHQLGGYTGKAITADSPAQVPADKVVEVDADADLARQYQQASAPVTVADMTIGQLRKEAVRRGVKIDRKDTMVILRQKIDALDQNPA